MSEPNADKLKPGRRTVKRLLIAILSLGLLIGAGSWLTGSRSDPRFLGRWAGQQVVDGTELNPFTIDFDDGGDAILTFSGQRSDPYFWRIKEERLELTYKGSPVSRFGRALGRLFGVKSSTTASLQITEASTDSMVLDAGVTNGKNYGWHLRRSVEELQDAPSSPTSK